MSLPWTFCLGFRHQLMTQRILFSHITRGQQQASMWLASWWDHIAQLFFVILLKASLILSILHNHVLGWAGVFWWHGTQATASFSYSSFSVLAISGFWGILQWTLCRHFSRPRAGTLGRKLWFVYEVGRFIFTYFSHDDLVNAFTNPFIMGNVLYS